MIKVYKDFFDSDCLEYIEKSIEKSKNTANLKSSFFYWGPDLIQQSTPVIVYDLDDADILLKRLKEIIVIERKVHFQIYYWPIGSYIPWHDDSHVRFTATVYCNRDWEMDWGGLFLYKEKDKILAEAPEWNKLVVQANKDWHTTTSVTKPLYWPVGMEDGQVTLPPIIRTTIQIFEEKEGIEYVNK